MPNRNLLQELDAVILSVLTKAAAAEPSKLPELEAARATYVRDYGALPDLAAVERDLAERAAHVDALIVAASARSRRAFA